VNRTLAEIIAVTAVVGLSFAGPSVAQTVPGAVQPGQIERQFQKPPEPRAIPGGVHIPETLPKAPANAERIRFVLNRVSVQGVTVYPAESLREIYESMLGKEVTLAEVYAVADKLTARYRNDGYILSQVIVPAQAVEGGAIRLQAIEGYIAEVRYEGHDGALIAVARNYGDKLKSVRPLTAAVLERYLLLLNDIPGVSARAVLAPSKLPGASDLLIGLTHRAVAGAIAIDNRGGRSLGPERLSVDLDANTLFGRGARTGARLVTSGNRKLTFLSLQHDQFIGDEGGKLGLQVNVSRSEPDTFAIIPLNLESDAETYNLSYSAPVLRSRARNLYLRAAFSVHNGRTDLFGVRDTEDHLRVVRFGLTYDLADALAARNIVDIEFSHGLHGLGSSGNGDPLLSRPNGRVDFSKVTLYAARLQPLSESWSAFGAFSAQHAFDNLLSSELFSYGGEQFGRGHDPSELVGDSGAAIKLELRYSGVFSAGRGRYTLYGFYDHGQVRQRETGGLKALESAASGGIGLRVAIGRNLSGVIEVAKPVTHVVAQEGDQKARIFGGLSVLF
jgi:hemolysin activation/secretion protein